MSASLADPAGRLLACCRIDSHDRAAGLALEQAGSLTSYCNKGAIRARSSGKSDFALRSRASLRAPSS